MAYLRDLPIEEQFGRCRGHRARCRNKPKVALFNQRDMNLGQFCKRCGAAEAAALEFFEKAARKAWLDKARAIAADAGIEGQEQEEFMACCARGCKVKALTLWRPWPNAIFKHGKLVENRTWAPPDSLVGQWLAIHAGKAVDGEGIVRCMEILKGRAVAYAHDAQDLCGPSSVIVGVVRVRGWVCRNQIRESAHDKLPHDLARAALDSPWFCGPFGWVFDFPTRCPSPVPCTGHQGLWNLPAEVEREVRDQTERNDREL